MRSKKDVNLIFSERIKFLREEKGLTQIQLASKMNEAGFTLSKDVLSSLERGIVEPKISHIEAFCQFFDVTPNLLLGYTQTLSKVEEVNDLEARIILHNLGVTKDEIKNAKKTIDIVFNIINKE